MQKIQILRTQPCLDGQSLNPILSDTNHQQWPRLNVPAACDGGRGRDETKSSDRTEQRALLIKILDEALELTGQESDFDD